jgi:small subunit ribosomal protein S20
MPIKTAAKKALRQTIKHRAANLAAKQALAKIVKRTRKLTNQNKIAEAVIALKSASKALDKAAGKGIIKKNTAARIKSRLSKLVAAKK